MFEYHQTNGERGEILVGRAGNFIGFIINLGRVDLWAAYNRRLELIGDRYGSQGQAATACWHRCNGEPKILMREILAAAPS